MAIKKNDYKPYGPFKLWTIENFPFIEEDFDAITNYQLYSKIVETLKNVIYNFDVLASKFEEIENYFENLDVQEEIDNKLDEMAESGELAEIITSYLQMNGVLAYNTISDMSNAENIIDGSTCYTLGQLLYNDGKCGFYKVREKTGADVIDGFNIVALDVSDELIAERIPNYYINSLQTQVNNIEEVVENLNNKKWLFIGDSYSQGYTPDGTVTGWSTLLKNKMGLDSSTCIISDHGGAGFANTSYPYSQILTDLDSDSDVTDILIAGGYNDTYYPSAEITSGISTCASLIASKFPNAKVHTAFIGGTTNQYHSSILRTINLYVDQFNVEGFNYLPNLQYVLFDVRYLSSDGIHPNSSGQTAIANALYVAINGGYNYYIDRELTLDMSNTDHFTNSSPITFRLRSNNESSVLSSNGANLTPDSGFAIANNEFINIGRIPKYGIMGSYTYSTLFNIGNVIVHSTTTPAGYYNMNAQLFISNAGDVYIKLMPSASTDNLGYQTFGNCNNLQISYISINYTTDVM